MTPELLAAQLRERRPFPPDASDDQVIHAFASSGVGSERLERYIAAADSADSFLVLLGVDAELRALHEQKTTDEQLWTAYVAGDKYALAEINRRWRTHLTDYTLHRVQDQDRATSIVDDVFQQLAAASSLTGYIRDALFATAHSLTGATCDWRDRMAVFSAESPLGSPL